MRRIPVLDDEGEQVRHGGGPEPAQSVVVEAGVEGDDLCDVIRRYGEASVAALT